MNISTKQRLEKIYKKVDTLAKKGKENVFEYYKYIDELISNSQYGDYTQMLSYYYSIDVIDYIDVSVVKTKTWKPILFQTNSSFTTNLKKLYDTNNVYQISFNIYSQLPSMDISSPLSSTYSETSSSQIITPTILGGFVNLSLNDTSIYKLDIFNAEWEEINGVNTPTTLSYIQSINTNGTQSCVTKIPASYGDEYLIKSYSTTLDDYNYNFSIVKSKLLGQINEISSYSDDYKYLVENREFSKITGARKIFLNVTKGSTYSFIDVDNPSLSSDQNLLNRYKIAIDFLLQSNYVLLSGYWDDNGNWDDNFNWID